MDNSYEIIDALLEYYSGDIEEEFKLLEVLEELYQTTGDYQFRKEVEAICDRDNICKACLRGILIDTKVGYQDFDGYEMPEYTKVCTECGETF